jgi:hypothetical protein
MTTSAITPEAADENDRRADGSNAWALTPTELILYMPDYPVARDAPIDFTPGALLWSMDGGTVQPHIPLSALAPALRPGI